MVPMVSGLRRKDDRYESDQSHDASGADKDNECAHDDIEDLSSAHRKQYDGYKKQQKAYLENDLVHGVSPS